MVSRIDPGGLLARYYALERGPRVCLRVVRGRDAAGVRALCERRGTPLSELGLARLIHFDLAAQLVLCATALIDSAETVVGFGAIALADGRPLKDWQRNAAIVPKAWGLTGATRNAANAPNQPHTALVDIRPQVEITLQLEALHGNPIDQ